MPPTERYTLKPVALPLIYNWRNLFVRKSSTLLAFGVVALISSRSPAPCQQSRAALLMTMTKVKLDDLGAKVAAGAQTPTQFANHFRENLNSRTATMRLASKKNRGFA